MNENGFGYKRITATTTLKTGGGVLKGFFVSANSGATVTFYDNTSATGDLIVGSFVIPALGFYDCGTIGFGTGLHAVISGTATITVAIK